MTNKHKFIAIIDDRLWKSISRDLFSAFTLIAVCAVGYFLDSQALQWVGAIIFIFWSLSRVSRELKNTHMTIDQARKHLDELERHSR